jgi:hypothetical protein
MSMSSGKENVSNAGGNGWPVVVFLVQAWATSVEVFLHRRFGERYLGVQAAAILLLIPVYCLAWPHQDLQPMIGFLLFYVLMCAIHRIDGLASRLRGMRCHSYYTGWPHLMGLLKRANEVTVKRYAEPLLVLGIGYFIRGGNPPLGTYLIGSSLCLFLSVTLSEEQSRQRALDLNDAVIDQQQVSERFRTMRGDQG